MATGPAVITGWAVRTGPAQNLEDLWSLVLRGPLRPLPPPPMPSERPAGLDGKVLSRLDVPTAHAVATALEAWGSAGNPEGDPGRRIVRLGVAYGGIEGVTRSAQNPESVRPFLAVETCESITAAAIAGALNVQGSTRILCSACASGADAILDAAHEIESGRADVAVAGGSQGHIPDFLEQSYDQLRILSPDGHLRPFDQRRNGFRIGAGAALVVLESAQHCRERGARPLATILGGRATSDAQSLTTPNGVGLASAVRGALADAGLPPSAIQHVNAHGTGTIANDRIESRVLAQTLGTTVPVTSTKPITGHTFAAGGALELILAAAALRAGVVPPTSLDFQRDPEIEVDVVHSEPREAAGRAAISTSVGLGGQNNAMIVGLPE